ncbi:DUF4406 domain-containing protein [Vibrio cortegadensis]|uniref:DUF4406 domain-containing protein n=1 Tax=Vibrio cortegadensis TaxID=1328770 RepID=UPI0025B58EC6|nr:DUF4406 domain-containing protein [Vibrio cortegadensis]MDN3696817.1 DUF4406 domain-containing protein [Vibrio cortegadensis]
MKTKVYIAGPMSGLPEFNRLAFNKMDLKLSNKGFSVLNPALLPDGLSQPEYMDICCSMVRTSDCILMLSGWEHSLGANAEYHLARKLGKIIIHEVKSPGYESAQRQTIAKELTLSAYLGEEPISLAVQRTTRFNMEISACQLLMNYGNKMREGFSTDRQGMLKFAFEEVKSIEVDELLNSAANAMATGCVDNKMELVINIGKLLESYKPEVSNVR